MAGLVAGEEQQIRILAQQALHHLGTRSLGPRRVAPEVGDDDADLAAGDHAGMIDWMPEYKRFAPEGKFGHYLIMAGALGGAACSAPGELFSEYEASVGTGQVHVWFERPEGGWTA